MQKKGTSFIILSILLISLFTLPANAQFRKGSCKNPNGDNYCGSSSPDGCYCDNICTGSKDCCMDYQEVCKANCKIPSCPFPPSGCYYKDGVDSNGCKTCGELICNNDCIKDTDCTLNCISAPCPKPKCVNGKCTQSSCQPRPACLDATPACKIADPSEGWCKPTCGNGICEEGEADYCPGCTKANPPCMIACKIGTCPQDCKKICPANVQPICGTDGKTYSNSCEAEAAGVKVQCQGECPCKAKCTDSDGGMNYYVKGETSACPTAGVGPPCTAADDSCSSNSYLTEFYCSNDQSSSTSYYCGNGCKDGACIGGTGKKIAKQDVIDWINNNCKDNIVYPPTGNSVKK